MKQSLRVTRAVLVATFLASSLFYAGRFFPFGVELSDVNTTALTMELYNRGEDPGNPTEDWETLAAPRYVRETQILLIPAHIPE